MIKLAWKLNDKIMLVEGGVVKFLGGIDTVKLGYRKQWTEGAHRDPYFYYAQSEAKGTYVDLDNNLVPNLYQGNGFCTSVLGAYLNKNSMCKIGKYLYTIHNTLNEDNDTTPCHNYKIVEWDGIESNVNSKVFPSGVSGKIVHGYASRYYDGWSGMAGAAGIGGGTEFGLINYNGNLLGFGLMTSRGPQFQNHILSQVLNDPSGVNFSEIINYDVNISSWEVPMYYSFLYQPEARNGSGLTTFNFYASDISNLPGRIDYPSWMLSEYSIAPTNEANRLKGCMSGLAIHNYNIMSMEEFNGKFYASNAIHLMQFDFGSGIRKITGTDQNKYMPSPKWLNKFNGKLYMFAASGMVSEIIPNDDNNGATTTDIIDLSYVYPYNINYGGIHAREWGLERATKSEICTYGDEMLVFAQMGSGTYYLATSGDATVWTNRTTALPDVIRHGAGNISTFQDPHSEKLYVSFSTMVQGHGMNGSVTWGNETANIVHLYEYDGINFTKINWFVNPSWQNCGGFTGFDYQGPHISYPSGLSYPLTATEHNEVDASGNIINIETCRKFEFQYDIRSYLNDENKGAGGGMWNDEKFLYTGRKKRLYVNKLHNGPSDSSGITDLDYHFFDNEVYDICGDGSGYIFASAGSSGIASFGVDNVGQLTLVDHLGISVAGIRKQMIKEGNYLYVGAGIAGLMSYKISPSGRLTQIDRGDNSSSSTVYTYSIAKVGNKIYTGNTLGLETWEVSSTGTFTYKGISTSGAGYGHKIAYYNNYLYSSTDDDNKIELYTIESSGAKFNRYLDIPNLDMYSDMSLMNSDDQFLYFVNRASGICFYKNDTSGNLIHQHTIPSTLSDPEDYIGLHFPSGNFDFREHSLVYTLSKSDVYGRYGGVKAWDIGYDFVSKIEASPFLFKCRDYAILDYKIIDELSRNINVAIEYSNDNGCTWNPCDRFKDYETIQYLGEGTTNLTSSPSGEWHNFFWDFVKPFGYNVEHPYCQMRVTPSISNRS